MRINVKNKYQDGGKKKKIERLSKKEGKLVYKGYKAVDEGKDKKADRILGRAAKTENRIIKLAEKTSKKFKAGGVKRVAPKTRHKK